jgi:acetylornithine deacetylase
VDESAALGLLQTMVRVDSRTGTPGEAALVHELVRHMHDLGLEAEARPVEGDRYNAVGIWKGSGDGPSLLFNGHVDTNPLSDGWTVDPWGGVVDESFIYGLGVSNMKAGCASYLSAVRELVSRGHRPRGDVILTFVVGELQYGVGTVALIDQGLTADWFVNCEPTDLTALTMHAGAFDCRIEVIGETRHMSKAEEAADALSAACSVTSAIHQVEGSMASEHPELVRINVGSLRAGMSEQLLDTRASIVPDRAVMLVACRYPPDCTADDLLAAVEQAAQGALKDHPGTRLRISRHHPWGDLEMLPFAADPDSVVVKALGRAHEQTRGTAQATGVIRPHAYFGSDAAHLLHRAGVRGVVCGPGGRYNTMPDERVDLVDYFDSVRMHMALLADLVGLEDA